MYICRNLLIPTSSDIREFVHLGHRGRQVNEYSITEFVRKLKTKD